MKRDILSYVLRLLAFYALIILLPLEYFMIIGTSMFSLTAMAAPFGSLALIAGVGVLLFALFSGDFLLGALMALSFVVPGWIQGLMIRKKSGLGSILSVTTVARGGLLLLVYNRMAALERIKINELILGDAPNQLVEDFTKAGYPAEMTEMINEVVEIASSMIPAIITISALTFAFLSLCCTKFFARKTPFVFAGIRKISEMKVDASFTLGALVITVLTFFVKEDYKIIFINCLYVLWIIYSATGFAFIYRLLKKGLKNKGLSFLIAILVSVFSFGMLLPIMGIIGAFVKTDFDKMEFAAEKQEEFKQKNNDDEDRKED